MSSQHSIKAQKHQKDWILDTFKNIKSKRLLTYCLKEWHNALDSINLFNLVVLEIRNNDQIIPSMISYKTYHFPKRLLWFYILPWSIYHFDSILHAYLNTVKCSFFWKLWVWYARRSNSFIKLKIVFSYLTLQIFHECSNNEIIAITISFINPNIIY